MAIEILSSDVVDQIAAGEVVERPAHMVKELVENSLDAGATEISVDFSHGGRFVKVADNGSGMSEVDLPKAFLRFATSKIKESVDLWTLASFGFRGEALASISSVSKVTVFSSQDESGFGHRLTCAFGNLSPLEPVSRSRGSTVIVEELFQNVPARLKFMKTDAAEAGQIKQVLKALAMANSQVEFRVLQDSKLVFYWPRAGSQKERIESVLDITPLYEGVGIRGRVKARAFFTDPHQVSRVAKSLWFFAQNRYVQDRSLQAAVMEAYRNLLMNGDYTYAVCFLETDPSDIDVNIHPTKSQVKFVNPQEAFRAVQGAIREVLEQAPWLKQSPGTTPSIDYQDFTLESTGNSLTANKSAAVPTASGSIASNLEFVDESFQTTQFRTKPEGFLLNPAQDQTEQNSLLTLSRMETIGALRDHSFLEEPTENFGVPNEVKTQSTGTSLTSAPRATPLIRHWSLLQVIGQAGLTYLICQNEKGLVLVDQHAAHERVAFERLMAAWKGGKIEVQNFLFPLSVDLNEEKMEALRSRIPEFAKLGIELEELGPITVGIKSAPAMIKDRVLVEEVERIASEMIEWGDSELMEKAISEICARMACHSVLRAGQSLSIPEMIRLLEEMDEHPLSSFCPHGRPVSVNYSWPELEKDFGRRL
jgi:DNA mismatch repair protein MutL